jgi:hypothetical protein
LVKKVNRAIPDRKWIIYLAMYNGSFGPNKRMSYPSFYRKGYQLQLKINRRIPQISISMVACIFTLYSTTVVKCTNRTEYRALTVTDFHPQYLCLKHAWMIVYFG